MDVTSGQVNYSHNTIQIRSEAGAWAVLGGGGRTLAVIKLCNLANGRWQAGMI